jgi:hypothetical protein
MTETPLVNPEGLGELARALEAATEPSRDLDARIWCALRGWEFGEPTRSVGIYKAWYARKNPFHGNVVRDWELVAGHPLYTSSVDARAAECFPETLHTNRRGTHWMVKMHGCEEWGTGSTEALARRAAELRWLSASRAAPAA